MSKLVWLGFGLIALGIVLLSSTFVLTPDATTGVVSLIQFLGLPIMFFGGVLVVLKA